MVWRAFSIVAALLIAACAPEPDHATPAFWEVTGPGGEKGWLLGTIHSLERPADWRSGIIDEALAESDLILVEISDLGDPGRMTAIFSKLATSEGHPPLSLRVPLELQDQLRSVLDANGLDEDAFASTETWAAALMIAQAEAKGLDSEYGIDRAVLNAAGDKQVGELEGTVGQLSIFDALPEAEQRDLLAAIVKDANSLGSEGPELARAWREGDMAIIERESGRGLLADPELRAALFTGRNERWTERIAAELAGGREPFIAVGAAHMAGPDGLPAMLEALGFKVQRVQ